MERVKPPIRFISFDKELPVLISALEERYGKRETTDKDSTRVLSIDS